MKKRLEKKIEKMRRKKIHEALEMVLEINSTQKRSQDLTGHKPTAFFSFYGHISNVDITVYPDGWGRESRLDGWHNIQAYLDCAGDIEGMLEELTNKKKELQNAGKM